MNELILKLQKDADAQRARMSESLLASQADGCAAEDKAKHIAAFDEAEAQLKDTETQLKRATRLRDAEDAAQQHATSERQPAAGTQTVVARVHETSRPVSGGRVVIPANVRRTGALRAYRGERAEERAYQAGLWVAATQYGHQASRERYAEQFGSRDLHATTMSTTSNANGAYFVPDVLDLEILKLTEEYGVIRRYARNRPMSSDTWTGPRWTGVLTTTFVAEGTAPSQTEQTYDMISLVAKNLAAYGKMTRNLHEDALINLGDEWAEAAAIAFANKEDDCAFNGTGASTYGGITGLLTKVVAAANAASLFTATGHATLGALTLSDFWSVVGKFPSYPGASPMWFCHKEVYAASMGPLQTAAGGVTPQDIANGGIPRFLGYPVVPVNVMPAAASVTTGVTGILFGDLRLAVAFGDRRGVTFETGLINDDLIKQLMTLFCSERFDINCHTITDPKNSSNPGPVIGLKLG